MKPLISVIIPVYKVEDYIERCVRSLFSQTIQNGIEFIFVNDATKDKSIEILKKILKEYPNRIPQTKIIEHKVNKGLPQARYTGIKHAKGEYILHVDSDDYIDIKALEYFSSIAIDYPGCDIISGATLSIYDKNSYLIPTPQYNNVTEITCAMLRREIPCNIWNRLIKKSLYQDLLIPNINNGEDYVTMTRLFAKATTVKNISEITYFYTHCNSNAFQNQGLTGANLEDLRCASEFLKKYFKNSRYVRDIKLGSLKTCAIAILSCKSNMELRNVIVDQNITDILRVNINFKLKLLLILKRFGANSIINRLIRLNRNK